MSRPNAVLLEEADNVATVLQPIEPAEIVRVAAPKDERWIIAKEAIPIFHKIAMTSLSAGADISKFGEVIGTLIADVEGGALVHLHNLRSNRAKPNTVHLTILMA